MRLRLALLLVLCGVLAGCTAGPPCDAGGTCSPPPRGQEGGEDATSMGSSPGSAAGSGGDPPVASASAALDEPNALGCKPAFWSGAMNGYPDPVSVGSSGQVGFDLADARGVMAWTRSRGDAEHSVLLELSSEGAPAWTARLPADASGFRPVEVGADPVLRWDGDGMFHVEVTFAGLTCGSWPAGEATSFVGEDLDGTPMVCPSAPTPVRLVDVVASSQPGVVEVPFVVGAGTLAIPKGPGVSVPYNAWGWFDAEATAGAVGWSVRTAAGAVVAESSEPEVSVGGLHVFNPLSPPAYGARLPLAPGEYVFRVETQGVASKATWYLDAVACGP